MRKRISDANWLEEQSPNRETARVIGDWPSLWSKRTTRRPWHAAAFGYLAQLLLQTLPGT